jgi:hypothetical protein
MKTKKKQPDLFEQLANITRPEIHPVFANIFASIPATNIPKDNSENKK